MLKRQIITDAAGEPIGVLLPLEEYALVENILEERTASSLQGEQAALARKLEQMERAAEDSQFMEDLHATMSAFQNTDAEWWERLNISEARRNFSGLLARVERGEEVIVMRDGQEVAKISPVNGLQGNFPDMGEFREGIEVAGEPISDTVIRSRRDARY